MENRDYFQNIIKHLKQFPLLLILLGQSLKHLGKVWKVLQINLKPRRLLLARILLESFENFRTNPYYEPLLWFMIWPSIQCKCNANFLQKKAKLVHIAQCGVIPYH